MKSADSRWPILVGRSLLADSRQPIPVGQFPTANSRRPTQSVVKYMFDKEELANDYIPTGGSAIEMADWEIESADSNADSPKVGAWVRAFRDNRFTAEKHYLETV